MTVWVRKIFITFVIFYIILAAAVFFAQRKFIYFPPNDYHAPPANMTEVKTKSGTLGWYSPAQDGRPTVMVFHGNASRMDTNLYIFRDLQAAGYGVWVVGYSGYPGNAGRAAQDEIVAGALQQYEALRAKGVSNIVFYGTSLGSSAASQLAKTHKPDLLILDAPFNSMIDMTRRHMPFLPTSLLLKDKWDSAAALKTLNVRLIWIHGTADRVIWTSQGQKLYDGYDGPKSAHVIEGATHINTWLKGGKEIVLTALEEI